MGRGTFANCSNLSKFSLRRSRFSLVVWLVAITLVMVMVVMAYDALYQNALERQVMAETMRNPAMTSMLGPGYGLTDYTIGAMVGHQMLLFTAVAVAIMNILFVNKHTRADEEGGRLELIQALPVGRSASLMSTFIVAFLINLLLALIVGLSLYACGVKSVTLAGSLLFGSLLGVTGLFFAAITALFAQLTEGSRGSLSYSFATLGLFYVLRAMGDLRSEALALLSPLGIILRSQVYVRNLWWPVPLVVSVSTAFAVGAFLLNSKRDLGAGLIPQRPGRSRASVFLRSPLGLAFRLQRTSILGWIIGLLFLGLSYGSVFGDLELFFQSNDFLKDILPASIGFSLTEQFLAMLVAVLAMLATIPALLMVLGVRKEEKEGRLEHLFARAVARRQVLFSFLAMGAIIGVLSMFISGLGVAIAANVMMDRPIPIVVILKACGGQLPAIFAMLGVTVFVVGFFPQRTGFVWAYLGYSFFTVYFGVLLKLPGWVAKLSPFGHLAEMPVEPFDLVCAATLVALFIILVQAGVVGYTHRDLQA